MNFSRFYPFALVLALSACATQPPVSKYMDDDGYSNSVNVNGNEHNPDIVRVVRQEQFRNMLLVKREAGAEPNGHPLTIAPEELAPLLKTIKVRILKRDTELLFDNDHPQELQQFAEWLSEALAAAKPDEDIAFNFPQNRGLAIFTENMMTVGRVFVKDGKINIIFGTIQGMYEGQYLHTRILRRFALPVRAESRLTEAELVATPKAPLAANRKDWVILDPAVLRPATTTATPAAPARRSAEERLLKLQELKSKGLITEEEFQAKRREILEGV